MAAIRACLNSRSYFAASPEFFCQFRTAFGGCLFKSFLLKQVVFRLLIGIAPGVIHLNIYFGFLIDAEQRFDPVLSR